MLIPLSDGLPLRRIPFQAVTASLIILCVVLQLHLDTLSPVDGMATVFAYGAIPAVLFGRAELPVELAMVPAFLTPATSAFLHGDWWHLLGNMLFLWVLGDNVEDAMGHARFLAFYLLCAVLAALAHGLSDMGSTIPMIGASGAISGVIAAYLLLHPRAKIWALLFGKIPVRFRAYWLLGGWAAMQAWFALTAPADSPVAWWAHVGGFVAGAVLTPFFKRADMALFDVRAAVPPAPSVGRGRVPNAGGGRRGPRDAP